VEAAERGDPRASQRPDRLQRLWAPWREAYLAGDDPIEGCPFCVLPARDADHDRASLILCRGAHAFVVLNAYPYNPGHLMVVPYRHLGDLDALTDDEAEELWDLSRRAVASLRGAIGADGVNLGMNLGEASGAGIADHLHQHVVPRWAGDTNFMSVTGAGARVLPLALDDVYVQLRPSFDRP
jgi:ATP adenylyltransferase